jgi:hypothetical protein
VLTTDSNVWGGSSGYTYTFTRQPNATTDVDVVVVREGKNLKGRVLGFVLRTIGRRVLKRRSRTASKLSKPESTESERRKSYRLLTNRVPQ